MSINYTQFNIIGYVDDKATELKGYVDSKATELEAKATELEARINRLYTICILFDVAIVIQGIVMIIK